MCVHVPKERGRKLHSVALEFQLTLAKVGKPDKDILRGGGSGGCWCCCCCCCWGGGGGGCRPLDKVRLEYVWPLPHFQGHDSHLFLMFAQQLKNKLGYGYFLCSTVAHLKGWIHFKDGHHLLFFCATYDMFNICYIFSKYSLVLDL